MIPHIIHCCWFGGKPLPKDVLKNMESWKRNNPGFEIKIWSEKNFDYRTNRYTREAYECKKWAFVTDYVRLKVLYDFGGIYMDTDVEAVRPFGEMLANKAFSGFETEERISTGTIGAEKGNPWIALQLEYYTDRSFFKESGAMDLTTNVTTISRITAAHYPIKFNNTYQNLGDVTFYPFDYLCAKRLNDGKVIRTENTVTIHHFNGSWTGPKTKFIKFVNKTVGNKPIRIAVAIKHFLVKGIKK